MKVYKGNNFPHIAGVVTFTGVEVPLVNATVAFSMSADGGSTYKIDGRACTVAVDDELKTVHFTCVVTSADYDTVANYDAHVDVEFDGNNVTVPVSEQISVLEHAHT